MEILVYADWFQKEEPVLMGILTHIIENGEELYSFEYSKNWLKNENFAHFDQNLGLFNEKSVKISKNGTFEILLDSCPDGWGRKLISRENALLAQKENGAVKSLSESDYLLFQPDTFRKGALRFKSLDKGPFLSYSDQTNTPNLSRLAELEYACLQLESGDAENNPEYESGLRMLVSAGASLGGSRPKANVCDDAGNLWIAKFPSFLDETDVEAWEMLALMLAKASGIWVCQSQLLKLASYKSTFLTRRFDRTATGRIHFVSASALLKNNLGAKPGEVKSYLEIAEFISRSGAEPKADLEQLWRRIVFNICISNTDDHARNHGFLLTNKGWKLSLAYDMNPDEYGEALTLNINETQNALELDLALSVAKYFDLKEKQALHIISEIAEQCNQWYEVAKKLNIPPNERQLMSKAFNRSL
ncbi:MAG: HipA domain-containing protein [Bacteroidota bacterium]|nr:HipA domain-containing protein [Bacteroidota bacterium]